MRRLRAISLSLALDTRGWRWRGEGGFHSGRVRRPQADVLLARMPARVPPHAHARMRAHRAAQARWGDACRLAGTCRTQEKVRAPQTRAQWGRGLDDKAVFPCVPGVHGHVYERLDDDAQADALKRLGIEAFPFDIDGDYQPLKGPARETLLRRCAGRLRVRPRLRPEMPTCFMCPPA